MASSDAAGFDVGGKAALLGLVIGSFNLFIGVFNLSPLLPLDGGHIAGASFEGTLSSAGVFDAMQELTQDSGDAANLGIGTITTIGQARQALDSGAAFLVTPVTDTAIINAGTNAGIPVYPGGLTPTDSWPGGAQEQPPSKSSPHRSSAQATLANCGARSPIFK